MPKAHIDILDAIARVDMEALTEHLENGVKTDERLWRVILTPEGPRENALAILALLAQHNALPEGITLSTARLVMHGCGVDDNSLDIDELLAQPDINLYGIPQLPSPIFLFTAGGLFDCVDKLISRGIEERPLRALIYCTGSEIPTVGSYSPEGLENYKQRVLGLLTERIENQCRIAELLLSHPNDELVQALDDEEIYLRNKQLPFFVWAAIHNKADLIENLHFRTLFNNSLWTTEPTVEIATAFASRRFLNKLAEHDLFHAIHIGYASKIAAANGDNETLACLIDLVKMDEPTELQYLTDSTERGATPIACAVHNGHPETVEFLITRGVPVDAHALRAAARENDRQSLELLLAHATDIDETDVFGNTAKQVPEEQGHSDIVECLSQHHRSHQVDSPANSTDADGHRLQASNPSDNQSPAQPRSNYAWSVLSFFSNLFNSRSTDDQQNNHNLANSSHNP